MSGDLSAADQRQLASLFSLVDRDHSGSISKQEFTYLLRSLQLTASQSELDALIDSCDTNQNGEIDYDEFVQVMSRRQQTEHRRQELMDAFAAFEAPAAGGRARQRSAADGRRSGVLSMELLEKAVEMFLADGEDGSDERKSAMLDLLQTLPVDAGGGFHYEQVSSSQIS